MFQVLLLSISMKTFWRNEMLYNELLIFLNKNYTIDIVVIAR
jgi:hypothetical protein